MIKAREISVDPTFLAFAVVLADAVNTAVQKGVGISGSTGACRCPLGCFDLDGPARPGWSEPAHHVNGKGVAVTSDNMAMFAAGFESGQPFTFIDQSQDPYSLLGVAYRARFP